MHRPLGPVAVAVALLGLLVPALPAAAEPSLVVDGRGGLDLAGVRAPRHRVESLRLGRAYAAVAAAPSGRVLAARSLAGGRHRLVLGGTGPQRALATTRECLSSVALSGDGSRVTWAAERQDDRGCPYADLVHLVDVDTGERHDLPAPPRSGWFRTPATFSPDGALLTLLGLTADDRWIMRVFDARTGERLRELTDHLPTDVPPGADGGLVVRRTAGLPGGPRCRLLLLDPRSDAEPTCWRDDLRLTGPQAATVTASPDGRRLAWIDTVAGSVRLVLAPAADPGAARDVGPVRNGPGRPSLTWVGDGYLLARSPEDDARTLLRATTGRPVWRRAPITYGWVR